MVSFACMTLSACEGGIVFAIGESLNDINASIFAPSASR